MREAVVLAAMIASAAHAQAGASMPAAAQAAAKAFIAATSGRRNAGDDPPRQRPAPSPAPTLGVACSITSAGAQVIAVMPRSPAEAAGLKPGVLITSVNGDSLAGMVPDAVAAALRPPSMRVVYGLSDGEKITLVRTAFAGQSITTSSGAD